MHIVFVFAGPIVSEREQRLVQTARSQGAGNTFSVCWVPQADTAATRMEAARARVEQAVGRTSGHAVRIDGLFPGDSRDADVRAVTTKTFDEVMLALTPDVVVDLSGNEIANASVTLPAAAIIELWWDHQQLENLGALRAVGAPPSDVVVTVRPPNDPARYVAQRSVLTLTAGLVGGDRRNASSRSMVLLLRALQQCVGQQIVDRHGARTNPVNGAATSREKWQAPARATLSGTGNVVAGALSAGIGIASVVAMAVGRRLERVVKHTDAWELAYRTTNSQFVSHSADAQSVRAGNFTSYRGGFDRFYADPMAFSHKGIDAVFMEEYPYALRKGVISYALLRSDGTLSPPQRILEKPYHLSYPFVFRAGSDVYMVPESSANRTVDLYRCLHFPNDWAFEQTLLSNVSLTDATLYFDGTLWWMFGTIGEEGSYGWDELHLYWSTELSGPFTPHSANPVKCNAQSARPAGPLFVRDGVLIRPTQDCSESYGGAVRLCEIVTLTTTTFEEREVGRIGPETFPGMNGLHTLSASEAVEVIDLRPKGRWRR